jgi:bis(5'-nucleosyl)-tetraphosphatase (symmetrical)
MKKNKRVIIYGDLHGCFDEFIALRKKIEPSSDDREIVIGDILDRGAKSNELFRYIREQNIESVLGNHEYKYLRFKKHHENFLKTTKKIPMTLTQEQQKIFNSFNKEDLNFLEQLPFFIKIENLVVLHAGILNKIDLETANRKDLEYLLWIRYLKEDNVPLSLGSEDSSSLYWSELYNGKEGVIIYGHEPFKEVRVDRYSLGIDTGCVYGNRLTATIINNTKEPLKSYELVSIKSNQKEIV